MAVPVPMFPLLSVAVQTIERLPSPNVAGEVGGLHWAGIGSSLLSTAEAVKVTLAPFAPDSYVGCTPEMVTTGAVGSRTWKEAVSEPVLPLRSVALHMMEWLPGLNVAPDSWLQCAVTASSTLSLAETE